MDNKNTPAFPVLELKQLGDKMLLDCTGAGVTKLEFFACNAPNEIPSWFVHTPPEMKVTAAPRWEVLPKEQQEAIKHWFMGEKELPEELKWYSEAYKKHETEDRAFRLADQQARYFQWRVYYAEQLLAHLSTTQP
jgi:hypothetical protein